MVTLLEYGQVVYGDVGEPALREDPSGARRRRRMRLEIWRARGFAESADAPHVRRMKQGQMMVAREDAMANETVKIVRFHETGGAEVLKLEELPLPEPGKGEVRLRVKAIGLNRAEVMFRRGKYLAAAGAALEEWV